jgi:hypothetical protein
VAQVAAILPRCDSCPMIPHLVTQLTEHSQKLHTTTLPPLETHEYSFSFSFSLGTMPPRKAAGGDGGGSKKAQGQARKAEAADQKKAGKQKQVEEEEAKDWDKGAKSNSKA